MKLFYTPQGSRKYVLPSLFLLLFLSLLTTSCFWAQRQDAVHVPKMAKENVIVLAKKTAGSAGYALSDYKPPEAYFELSAHDRVWTVFFEKNTPSRDTSFQVWIDDNSGKAEVMTGK